MTTARAVRLLLLGVVALLASSLSIAHAAPGGRTHRRQHVDGDGEQQGGPRAVAHVSFMRAAPAGSRELHLNARARWGVLSRGALAQ